MKTQIKRIALGLLAAVIIVPLAIIAIQYTLDPGSSQKSAAAADHAQQIATGEYLARAGNCIACHTVKYGAAYAGGRAVNTPFGKIYASNITPDKDTGIGQWTADDFWRAIHNGKGKDGRFLYPAFPYPNYTKVSRADADAIFAYLQTVKPVRQVNKEPELRFPYNRRVLLAFWRTLYFKPGEFEAQPAQSAEWNRGAYLVQGLGHCSACHTNRNALGGTEARADLAGGMIPMIDWYAASLTSDPASGLGKWSDQDVADLIHSGVSQRGAVYGPMAEVVYSSTQHLTDADAKAMAAYIKTVPEHDPPEPAATPPVEDAMVMMEQGARIYKKQCSACHEANGHGQPPAYPSLAGSRSLTAQSPVNPIRIVLNGGYPPSTAGNAQPYGMPPFAGTLNDDEVAAVVSFIRMSWGNNGGLVSPIEVARHRGVAEE
ncbi:MAG: cytochrome c [Burkholderiaceae bacterium]|nr:cytochrome c [Burkholderiaceae bacterium]